MATQPAAPPAAPPVVAVVIAHDPGSWFEECLSSLSIQDYPNLSVLVIDAASQTDPTPRVASVLPHAFVRRSSSRYFAPAANEVLEVVDGAALYVFCHDDVALEPDAVRIMVEEAYRSNAGVVGPKVVQWDAPEHLRSVGETADRFGVVHPLVDPGELDQEQHDGVRDVFLIPSGATVVRADLFAALGGFDPVIDQVGEDLDLCWRVQVAGARVIVAPAARVRHVGAQGAGLRRGWELPAGRYRAAGLAEAHRLRTLLVCYGLLHLLVLVPLAGIGAVGEALVHLVRGRRAQARLALDALRLALRHPSGLWQTRRLVQQHRALPDREVHRMQSRGSVRLRALLRHGLGGDAGHVALGSGEAAALAFEATDEARGRPLTEHLPSVTAPTRPGPATASGLVLPSGPDRGALRAPVTVGVILVLLVIIGSRSLFSHALPPVGGLPTSAGSLGSWWHQWWSTWRTQGLGQAGAGAPAIGLMALVGSLFFGAIGTFTHVVVLAPLLVGPWGLWRVSRPLGSMRARLVAVVVYAAVPLPYNALADGRWGGAVVYAAAPWILGALSAASGDAPYASVPTGGRRFAFDALRLGLLVGLVAAFVPAMVVAVPVFGVILYLGAVLAGRAASGVRGVAIGVVGGAIGFLVLLPWSAEVFSSTSALFGVSGGTAARRGLGQILRFDTGPVGTSWLGWALIGAAALALIIGRSWRLGWAARWWVVALGGWGLAWLGLRGWLPVPLGIPEVVLAPAAAALALVVGLGMAAFERDLPGYRFGWPQLASALAAVAVVISALPGLWAVTDGRWHIPSAGAYGPVIGPQAGDADYRILWVGAPQALPAASWRLADGVGYATSLGSGPELSDLWLPGSPGAGSLLGTAVRLAEENDTTQLGHLLAPLAVRYLVVPASTAPTGAGGRPVPAPGNLLAGLQQQTDLLPLVTDPNYTVYENAAWSPGASILPAGAATAAATPGPADTAARLRVVQGLRLPAGSSALPGALRGAASGRATGGSLYVAVPHGAGVRLKVAGRSVAPAPAFGWASLFTLPAGGGDLHFQAGHAVGLRVGQVIELIAVVVLAAGVAVDGRRRRGGGPVATSYEEPPSGEGRARVRERAARPAAWRPVAAPVGGFDEDLWSDD